MQKFQQFCELSKAESMALPRMPVCPNRNDTIDDEQLNKWLEGWNQSPTAAPDLISSHGSQDPQLKAIGAMLEHHHNRLQQALDARLLTLRSELLRTPSAVRNMPQRLNSEESHTTCSVNSGDSHTDVGSFHNLELQDLQKNAAGESCSQVQDSAKNRIVTPRNFETESGVSPSHEEFCNVNYVDLEASSHVETPEFAKQSDGAGQASNDDTAIDFETISNHQASSHRIGKLVHSQAFDCLMAALICLNVVVMFADLEKKGHSAAVKLQLKRQTGVWSGTDGLFEAMQHFFNLAFLLELLLRFAADGCKAFRSVATSFDAVLVAISGTDYILGAVLNLGGANISFLRMLRMLKIMKVFKAVRAAAVFSELRIIITSLLGSMMALAWSCVVLFVIMLFSGILLAQLVAGVIDDESAEYEVRKWAFQHYGTGSRAFYTLFEATLSGGWPNYARRMIEDVSGWFSIFWIIYVLLVVFAVMRVITAIFLQKTMKIAGADENKMLMEKVNEEEHMEHVTKFLAELDTDGNGIMTKAELEFMLQEPTIQQWLSVIGLESKEVISLFAVLDDGNGEVPSDALVKGITRLSCGVRAIDSVMMMHEQHKIVSKLDNMFEQMSNLPSVVHQR